MSKLTELRHKLGKAIDKMNEHAEAGGEAYDAAKKEAADTRATIERVEESERLKAEAAQPITEETRRVEPIVASPKMKGLDFTRIVRALAATKGDHERAAGFAAKMWGREADGIAKALAAGNAASGGFLVPEQTSAEIIELLRARVVVMRAGARLLPLPNGNLTMPRVQSGSSAQYIGENTNAPSTQPGFGNIKFTARKLAALVPISNDLIRFASPNVDVMVRDDLIMGMQVTADAAFIRDTGAGNAPKGLRYQAAAANIIPAATSSIADITSDLGKLELAVWGANTPMLNPAYILAPRSLNFIRNLRDTNGVLAFPEVNQTFQMSDPARPTAILRGFPAWTTTSIPVNLSGTQTEIYFGDMTEVAVAEVEGIVVDASDTAAYHDGANVVAAFSLDQTVIRAIVQHDLGVRHDTSIGVLTGVVF